MDGVGDGSVERRGGTGDRRHRTRGGDRRVASSRSGFGPGALVVASVGTDVHPFDRLVSWVDGWARCHPEVRVVIQRGNSTAPDAAESEHLIAHPELCRLFGAATAVVSHGGPSTVMDARAAGRMPIVVPRNPTLGEHVDDHQLRFGRHLERHGLAVVASDAAALHRLLDAALADPRTFAVDAETTAVAGVEAFGRVVDDLLVTVPRSSRSRRPARR
ncbi:MAG: glycosyltransferase [Acidimicrobiales bacterium]